MTRQARRLGEPDGRGDVPDTVRISAGGCDFAVAVIGSGPEHDEAVAALQAQSAPQSDDQAVAGKKVA